MCCANRGRFVAVTLLVLCAGGGCAGREGEESSQGTGKTSPAVEQWQREQALAAREQLSSRLSQRLMEVMGAEGPAAAIRVCREEALEITAAVGESCGVKIGRTSFHLRNPRNKPPDWAAEGIEKRVEEPQFVTLPDGQLGALLPIRLQPQCLLCHGPPEGIPDEVKQALAEDYPDDQATGFELDALRGWFWIEVPAAPATEAGA